MTARRRRYFEPDRIRYFVTSSLGFYVDPSTGYSADDCCNMAMTGDGRYKIRGEVNPLNVIEPLLWLNGIDEPSINEPDSELSDDTVEFQDGFELRYGQHDS